VKMARTATLSRVTGETSVRVTVDLDGAGVVSASTGVAFFDHMLDALGRHSLMDMAVEARGDLEVDAHHTVEDVGIVLGQAIASALGDKSRIRRFGTSTVPMDESLVMASIDISGRGGLYYDVELPIEFIGTFDTSLAKEFLTALASNASMTVHIRKLAGENSHHIIEAAFKALALALRAAVAIDPRVSSVPSTKGTL